MGAPRFMGCCALRRRCPVVIMRSSWGKARSLPHTLHTSSHSTARPSVDTTESTSLTAISTLSSSMPPTWTFVHSRLRLCRQRRYWRSYPGRSVWLGLYLDYSTRGLVLDALIPWRINCFLVCTVRIIIRDCFSRTGPYMQEGHAGASAGLGWFNSRLDLSTYVLGQFHNVNPDCQSVPCSALL